MSLTANVGTKRGQGKGSFVSSVVNATDRFYAEASSTSSHGPRPRRKSRTTNHPQPIKTEAAEMAATEAHDIEIGNGLPARESALAPTLGLTESAGD